MKALPVADLLVRVRHLIAAKQAQVALRAAERIRREGFEERNRQLQAQSKTLSELFQRAPGFMAVLRAPQHVFELANAAYLKLLGNREVLTKPIDIDVLAALLGERANQPERG